MFKIVNFCVRKYSSNILPPIMKYLSVAEKNDAAKTIAGHLSRGTANRVNINLIFLFSTTYLFLFVQFLERRFISF